MTFATALRARDAGLPVPAGLVGLCPALDLDCTEKRNHPNYHRDALIPLSALESVVKMGAEVDGHLDPRLSPVNHVLAGMPPALLIVAEDEVLRRDSEIMAHRLAQSGVPAPSRSGAGRCTPSWPSSRTCPRAGPRWRVCRGSSGTALPPNGSHAPRSPEPAQRD